MEYTSLRQDRKISLYAAIFAFIVSLLAGMAVKNPVGVLFLRAIISMFLFGAVIWGALYILRKYIPDIIPGEEQVSGTKRANGETRGGGNGSGNIDFSYTGGVKQDSMFSGNRINESRTSQESMASEKVESPYIERPNIERPYSDWEPSEASPGVGSDISKLQGAEIDRETSRDKAIPSLDHLFDEEERKFTPDIEIEREEILNQQRRAGEYIDVGKFKIPNQPEILAKAIKKMMKESSYE
jgi:hypothetical protein